MISSSTTQSGSARREFAIALGQASTSLQRVCARANGELGVGVHVSTTIMRRPIIRARSASAVARRRVAPRSSFLADLARHFATSLARQLRMAPSASRRERKCRRSAPSRIGGRTGRARELEPWTSNVSKISSIFSPSRLVSRSAGRRGCARRASRTSRRSALDDGSLDAPAHDEPTSATSPCGDAHGQQAAPA